MLSINPIGPFSKNNQNSPSFKGCDISQINKAIIKEHVEWANLTLPSAKLMTNLEVEGKVNKIWNEVLKIYDKYKDDKKIKVVISSFKDTFGEHKEGIIQAQVGLENFDHFEKVSCHVNNSDFPLLGLVQQEARGYKY